MKYQRLEILLPRVIAVLCLVCFTGCAADVATAIDDATSQDETATEDTCANPGLVDQPVAVTEFVATASDFDCTIEAAQVDKPADKRWYQVRNFMLKNLAGRTQEALDVACGRQSGEYPIGTIVQLIPLEAMVKRGNEFEPAVNDWEFFFMDASRNTDFPADDPHGYDTAILTRGGTNTENAFGGNCFDCHQLAGTKSDFLCEQGNGCDPINGASSAGILRDADSRCNAFRAD